MLIIDILVPHDRSGRGGGGGLQGFSQGQGSAVCSGAEFSDIPVPQSRGGGGGLLGLRPDPNSAASSSRSYAVDEAFTGGFRTFHHIKKSARLGPHSGSELGADFNPWTPEAYAEFMAVDDDESETESEAEEDVLGWISASAGLHAVPRAPDGTARVGVRPWRQVHHRTLLG